jgi:hypothetical protein
MSLIQTLDILADQRAAEEFALSAHADELLSLHEDVDFTDDMTLDELYESIGINPADYE